ncbi:MAG: ABC transporter ATP-binding protein [Lachnospiraceae bacterium]|jgi:putative ABC transport system ATP-binding protein|nr:ABC transporter ATP-binding protein [Lachnospiraceae bacterium]
MEAVIEVRDLYKLYKVGDEIVRALNGVSFNVFRGEFCAIVGTSGSGKSTLLNMLAGLEKPTKGSIRIHGTSIEKLKENQLVQFRREHVGFIFQSFHLLSTFNALENTALPLSFQGVSKSVRLKKAAEMLKLVNLDSHARHMPNQLSGGQQQRVGIARALIVDPDIIFADEPTGNLDSRTSQDVMNLMRDIVNKRHKTLIMVTHDMNLAEYADRIFEIRDGKFVRIREGRKFKPTEMVRRSANY